MSGLVKLGQLPAGPEFLGEDKVAGAGTRHRTPRRSRSLGSSGVRFFCESRVVRGSQTGQVCPCYIYSRLGPTSIYIQSMSYVPSSITRLPPPSYWETLTRGFGSIQMPFPSDKVLCLHFSMFCHRPSSASLFSRKGINSEFALGRNRTPNKTAPISKLTTSSQRKPLLTNFGQTLYLLHNCMFENRN